MAFTIGLLGFLAIDGYLEGTEIGAAAGGAFGGVELLFLGVGDRVPGADGDRPQAQGRGREAQGRGRAEASASR